MSNDLKSMLLEAVGLPPEKRRAYIAERSGGDTALRSQLESLVAAWDDATTLLRDAGASSRAPSLAPGAGESAGEHVGPFVLEERLGEGGFGVVWRARQESPVRRTVALKVLRAGMERADFLARFEHERQALARLSHPSIASIFDAGVTASGRPYFAMELVEGEPITSYCDNRQLPLRARLAIFRDVCMAVHHAHVKGVIHRDLKPSNILVTERDGKPLPKVIDFGVAKATDEPLSELTLVTLARQIVGTPRYMSPEQASLDSTAVDTRSDVYSLGVILYELLCGLPPIPDGELSRLGLADLHRALRSWNVARPSERLRQDGGALHAAAEAQSSWDAAVLRDLSGDLDWITMMAIAPEPAERYSSASALGAEVTRWLDGDPVLAHPPTAMYLARKFARRHRAIVAGACVSALLLTAGVIGTSVGLVRATRAERAAMRERDAAEEALAQANAVSEFLENMISSVDPQQRGRDVRVVELLDEAAADIDERFAGQDAIRARLLGSLATAYWSLGEVSTARDLFERALPLRIELYGDEHDLTLRTMANLVSLRYLVGDVVGAVEASETLMATFARIYGERSERYVDVLSNYAVFLARADRPADALAAQERVVELQTALRGRTNERTIGAMINLAALLRELGDQTRAMSVSQEALAAADESLGPEHPTTLLLRGNVAILYERQGDRGDAIGQYETVLQIEGRVLGEQHPSTLLTARNLASVMLASGREVEAMNLIRRVLAALPDPIPPTHRVATSLPGVLVDRLAGDPGWDPPGDIAAGVADIIRANSGNASLDIETRDYFVQAIAQLRPLEYRDTALAVALAQENEAIVRGLGREDAWSFVETVAFALDADGRHEEAAAEQRRAIAEADALGVTGPEREAMDVRLAKYEGAAGTS